MHRYLQPSVVKRYEMQESRVAHRLLRNLSESPESFFRHIRRYAVSIATGSEAYGNFRSAAVGMVLLITYGHEGMNSQNSAKSSRKWPF